MNYLRQLSLRLRLALMFSLAFAMLAGVMGIYIYQALESEICRRDDDALLGRVDRMKLLIEDYESIDRLRQHPQLYANMLGNQDNLLWVLDQSGKILIEINPAHLPLPALSENREQTLFTAKFKEPVRLAWIHVDFPSGRFILIAGKITTEREKMLADYQIRLLLAWLAGAILSFALCWALAQRGLQPLRKLSDQLERIDTQHMKLRLSESDFPLEVRMLSMALNQMLDRLEDGFVRLSRYSEDLAHEMRTPLNNLMGQNQQVLSRFRTVQEYENLLVSKQEEYERLARMIDNMLFLARAEKPASFLQLESVDLAQMATQLCEYFEGMASERGMEIQCQIHGALMADPSLLQRAIANLLANAIRYGAANSVVHLRNAIRLDGIDIEVINQGAQIAPQHLPYLFDRFYRCDPSRAQAGDSGGLGLAIVQSIMQMHQGEVLVNSEPDLTCFTLRFHRRT